MQLIGQSVNRIPSNTQNIVQGSTGLASLTGTYITVETYIICLGCHASSEQGLKQLYWEAKDTNHKYSRVPAFIFLPCGGWQSTCPCPKSWTHWSLPMTLFSYNWERKRRPRRMRFPLGGWRWLTSRLSHQASREESSRTASQVDSQAPISSGNREMEVSTQLSIYTILVIVLTDT